MFYFIHAHSANMTLDICPAKNQNFDISKYDPNWKNTHQVLASKPMASRPKQSNNVGDFIRSNRGDQQHIGDNNSNVSRINAFSLFCIISDSDENRLFVYVFTFCN